MKFINVLGIVVSTALLSIGGTFLIMEKNYDNELDRSHKEDEREDFVSTVDTTHGWENPMYSDMIDEWKSGDEPFIDNLIQEVIQQMSHQKIIADEKEKSIMITPIRIDTLIQMVEENKDEYEYDDKYLDILKRWKTGDFSAVDDDHNAMMRVQGSKTVGAATGIASEEQEIQYIFQVFGKAVERIEH